MILLKYYQNHIPISKSNTVCTWTFTLNLHWAKRQDRISRTVDDENWKKNKSRRWDKRYKKIRGWILTAIHTVNAICVIYITD